MKLKRLPPVLAVLAVTACTAAPTLTDAGAADASRSGGNTLGSGNATGGQTDPGTGIEGGAVQTDTAGRGGNTLGSGN